MDIKNDLTNLTVVISKELKHQAKVKATMEKITLKEYVEKLIKEDLKKVK